MSAVVFVRFRKISHGLLLRERKSRSRNKEERPASSPARDTFRYFSHIAGYEGIFITGKSSPPPFTHLQIVSVLTDTTFLISRRPISLRHIPNHFILATGRYVLRILHYLNSFNYSRFNSLRSTRHVIFMGILPSQKIKFGAGFN